MASALSGHLVKSYMENPNESHSFNPQMHGTPVSYRDPAFLPLGAQPSFAFSEGLSEATSLKIAAIQAKLNQKLGPEYISQRPGPAGGPKLTYAEGWKIINLANEVFGFNGWSSNVISLTTDFIDFNEESRRYSVGVTAIMRVTLGGGVYHEDIGYGILENSKSKGAALDKCKKEAVTDGLKRALRNFGNLLGNCLYDKSYTQEVIKIKVPPPKFDKEDLHRRPEFDGAKSSESSKRTLSNIPIQPESTTKISTNNELATPTRQPTHNQDDVKPFTSLPSHMRPEVLGSTSANAGLNTSKFVEPQKAQLGGLNTPVKTPSNYVPRSKLGGSERNFNAEKPLPTAAPGPPAHHAITGQQIKMDTDLVSIANQGDDGESFHFDSDDDAFLAAVDLGNGDTGQPVEEVVEEGDSGFVDRELESLGRPINFEDEHTLDEVLKTEASEDINNAIPRQAAKPDNVKGSSSRLNAIVAGLGTGSGASTGILSKLSPQQNQRKVLNDGESSITVNDKLNLSELRANPVQGNSHPNTIQTISRSMVRSLGGSRNSPNVNIMAHSDNKVQSTSEKRPAEFMGSSSVRRNLRPGMGLQREVLGSLEGDRPRDAKRLKR